MKISILVPTCNRPHLLAECLESCIQQTCAASEIIIGDDSSNSDTERLIQSLSPLKCSLNYTRNTPALGQAMNIDALIHKATGELLCLIHDDDKLELDALERLSQVFMTDSEIVIAFGKQYILSDQGELDMNASVHLNNSYSRIPSKTGKQPDIIKSAILQQIPNNGFLVRSDHAKRIGYAKAGVKYGDACDLGFALELAMSYSGMKAFFLNEYTAYYRLSTASVLRTNSINNVAYMAFRNLYPITHRAYKHDHEINLHLEQKVSAAIANAIQLNKISDASKWILSRYHRKKIVSLGGAKRMLNLGLAIMKICLTRRWSQFR